MSTRQRNGRFILVMLGLALMAWLIMAFNGQVVDLRRLNQQQDIVRGEYSQRLATKSALQTQIVYATSDLAVERWAREDQHMIREGDHPAEPLGAPGITPTATPTLIVTPTPEQNWDSWKALFFGPQTP